jgi:protein-tyrosine phosphatase
MDMTAPPDAVTRALVAQMAGEIGAKQVLLVHCTHGRDRTGFVCAAYQMLRRGYSLDAALAIRADYGVTGPFHTLMNHSFTQALKRLAQPEPQP